MIKENQKEQFIKVFLNNFKDYFNSSNFNLYEKDDGLVVESSNHIKKIALNRNNLNIRFYDDSLKEVINKMLEACALEVGLKNKEELGTNGEEQPKRKFKL